MKTYLDFTEQIQLQIDVVNMKKEIDSLRRQMNGLMLMVETIEQIIISSNQTMKAHHDLLITIGRESK